MKKFLVLVAVAFVADALADDTMKKSNITVHNRCHSQRKFRIDSNGGQEDCHIYDKTVSINKGGSHVFHVPSHCDGYNALVEGNPDWTSKDIDSKNSSYEKAYVKDSSVTFFQDSQGKWSCVAEGK